jgi:hypothetical protein
MRLLLAALIAFPALALAQGSLTPPVTTPAPSMKSLEQIEPRVPVMAGAPGVTVNENGGFNINVPGSYYLTGNLTVASGNGIGISIPAAEVPRLGVTVRNGRIFGPTTQTNGIFTRSGFYEGIYGDGYGIEVEDVAVFGIGYEGIIASRIVRCTAHLCGDRGLDADTVLDSRATECGGLAILAKVVANCYGEGVSSSSGGGIFAERLVTDSWGSAKAGKGIETYGQAANCYGKSTTNSGLECGNAINCRGESGPAIGLYCASAVGSEGISDSSTGLQAWESATGCHGTTNTGNFGLRVYSAGTSGVAENCRGKAIAAGTGLSAETATNCFGSSGSGTGLFAGTASNCTAYTASGSVALAVAGTAQVCRGNNGGPGNAISAAIAVACTSAHGPISATNKYLMP